MLTVRSSGVVTLWLVLNMMGSYCKLLSNSDSCIFQEHPTFEEALSKVSSSKLHEFNANNSHILDLSDMPNALSLLAEFLLPENSEGMLTITTLNMSSAGLKRVPTFNYTTGNHGADMASQLRVLILSNNELSASFRPPVSRAQDVDVALSAYDALRVEPRTTEQMLARGEGMNSNNYLELQRLDLRNCSITYIEDHSFQSTPKLELLYLERNFILTIESLAFSALSNLKYLGLSKNNYMDEKTISSSHYSNALFFKDRVFTPLTSLVVLDLSYSRVSSTNAKVFSNLGENFSVLSLCNSQIKFLPPNTFQSTQMKLLDISGNMGILNDSNELFGGIEDSLQILLAESIGLNAMNALKNLKNLKVLNLKHNFVRNLNYANLINFQNLVILDLTGNRITNWFTEIFRHMASLKYLSLNNNNLSLLSYLMLRDFSNLKSVGITGNSFVCSCYVRIFIEVVNAHSNVTTDFNADKCFREILDTLGESVDGFKLADIIQPRIKSFNMTPAQDEDTELLRTGDLLMTNEGSDIWTTWNLTFSVLDVNHEQHSCIESDSGTIRDFEDVKFCSQSKGITGDLAVLKDRQLNGLYILLAASTIVIPLAGFIGWKWWYIRYFVVMIKNVAMLSLMKKNVPAKDPDHPFVYDVFVSYCKGDREWVLSELLVHIEEKSNINVCLHERDFQVGLSILENIITCIDRSRAILLVVSQEFLLSQWCQFEMHLAQHRLLETRREKLIIILLEDIPKRKRPNTLQYLMLTKTYIIWPKGKGLNVKVERDVFWRRLKKSVLHGKETYDVGTFA